MLKFFDWTFHAGAKMADELEYVPMPKDVVPLIQSAWEQSEGSPGPTSMAGGCNDWGLKPVVGEFSAAQTQTKTRTAGSFEPATFGRMIYSCR